MTIKRSAFALGFAGRIIGTGLGRGISDCKDNYDSRFRLWATFFSSGSVWTAAVCGSTRLIVAFLNSLLLIVLKSSASAIDAKHTIKITRVGVLISAMLGFSGEGQPSASRKKA
jgi:hypothetical protein